MFGGLKKLIPKDNISQYDCKSIMTSQFKLSTCYRPLFSNDAQIYVHWSRQCCDIMVVNVYQNLVVQNVEHLRDIMRPFRDSFSELVYLSWLLLFLGKQSSWFLWFLGKNRLILRAQLNRNHATLKKSNDMHWTWNVMQLSVVHNYNAVRVTQTSASSYMK